MSITPLIRLGDLVDRLTNGYVGATKNIYIEKGIPYLLARQVKNNVLKFDGKTYVSEEFNEKNKKSILKTGDVLLVQSGHIGHSAVVPEEHSGHNCHAMIVITPKSLLLGDYLSLFFNTPYMQEKFQDIRTGSTVPHLTCKLVKELLIPVPSISEQKATVEYAANIIKSIDKARANAEQNLKNARELFDSYLQQVFSQGGDHWSEKKLVEVCVLQRGFDLPKRLRKQGQFPLVSSSGIIDTHIEAKVMKPGVVTGRSGSIGNVFYVEDDFWPLNTTLYVKDFNGNNEAFVYWLLKKFDLSRYTSGAGVPTLNRNNVHDEIVYVPNDPREQIQMVQKIETIHSHIVKMVKVYEDKITVLEELKKSMLQKAFSGKLTNSEGQAA